MASSLASFVEAPSLNNAAAALDHSGARDLQCPHLCAIY